MAAWTLSPAHAAAGSAQLPQPEAEQVVSAALKKLYMASAAATPRSPEQQKVILQMAEKASNGKELLLTMRAAAGTFPPANGSQQNPAESQVRSMVTAKMIELGTLDQLIDYDTQYSVNPENARPFVQRMFQLAGQNSDSRVWHRIRIAASHLKVSDLERQAQARVDQLAGR
jgi:hypothetical protein